MTGWTYVKIDNNLRRYKIPCSTLQHRQCERLGHCVEPYITGIKGEKYFKLCRKITFRVLQPLYHPDIKCMTINPNIKFLGIAVKKRGAK